MKHIDPAATESNPTPDEVVFGVVCTARHCAVHSVIDYDLVSA